jgi:hypothetical protein
LFNHENIKYVTWVLSDNIYEPEFIEVLRRAFLKGTGKIGLVYSSFRSIDQKGRPLLGEKELAFGRQSQAQPKEALLDTCFIGVSFLYKTHLAKQIDGYRLEPVEDAFIFQSNFIMITQRLSLFLKAFYWVYFIMFYFGF